MAAPEPPTDPEPHASAARPAPPARASRHRALKLLALQLVLWPLALVLGELGLRGVRAAFGPGYSADDTRAALVKLRDANRDFVPRPNDDLPWNPEESERAERVLHPYVGFEIVGGLQLLEDQLHEFKRASASHRFRIALFGGSVAQIFAESAGPQLTQLLRADPRFAGVEVELLSFARGGFRQPQLQAFLAYLFAIGLTPDAVVCLDGFNEVAIGAQNASFGTHVSFPSVPHWAQLLARGADRPAVIAVAAQIRGAQRGLDTFATWALDRGVERSAIAGELSLAYALTLRRRCLAGFQLYTELLRTGQARRALTGPPVPADEAEPVVASVALWSEASRNMRALCEARRIPYFHALQPTLHDEGAKPMHADEVRDGAIDATWLAAVRSGYPLLRAAGAKLADEGERFFDASLLFKSVTEPLYSDCCHLNAAGNERLANALAPALLGALR